MTAGLSAPTRDWMQKGGFARVGGHRMFHLDVGPVRPSGPTLVFVHGFPTSSRDWWGTIEILRDTHRCVAMDLLGFGLSDKPEAWSYSLFQQADLVEELLDQLAVDRAHVVSHDMGTSLHTELLSRRPRNRPGPNHDTDTTPHTELLTRRPRNRPGPEIVGSTFLNGSILKGEATLTRFQQILETPSSVPRAMEICRDMVPGYVEGLRRLMANPRCVDEEEATIMTELLAHRNGNERIPAVYSYVRERYLHTNRWLGAIGAACEVMPVQFVWGEADPVANVEMGRALAVMFPAADYHELSGVGHFTPLEAPTEVAHHVAHLQAGLSPAG